MSTALAASGTIASGAAAFTRARSAWVTFARGATTTRSSGLLGEFDHPRPEILTLIRGEVTIAVGIESRHRFLAAAVSVCAATLGVFMGGGAFGFVEPAVSVSVPTFQLAATVPSPIMEHSSSELLPLLSGEYDKELIEVPHRRIVHRVGDLFSFGHQLADRFHIALGSVKFLSDLKIQFSQLGTLPSCFIPE
jgi:hypothetical protein